MTAARALTVWKRIETWLGEHSAEGLASLGPPATEEALRAVESAIGAPLPAEARASYLVHDGQVGGGPYLLGEWKLLSLEHASKRWHELKESIENGTIEDTSGEAIGPTRDLWWSTRWVPVISNGSGDYQCLDLDPAPGGSLGQIVSYSHTGPEREVLAANLLELLEKYADELEAGAFYDDDGWLVRR